MDDKASQSGPLSAREQEIAQAFAGGESYVEIAKRLGIAPSTVRTHLATIYRKLGVTSKLDLHKHLDKASLTRENRPHAGLSEKPSIAVLAFENMSDDPAQAFFSDGISEDIITALSRSSWLFIIARNTTFTYKGRNVDVKEIARDLGCQICAGGQCAKGWRADQGHGAVD